MPSTPPVRSTPAPPGATEQRRTFRIPWWKKSLFGLFVVAGFFVLAEGLLFFVGVPRLAPEIDPYVALETPRPLFQLETAPGEPPRRVTSPAKLRYFNPQSFSAKKPEGVFRVFCLGGSTTYGRPYEDATSLAGWLRELLPAVAPDQSWEVINAGGISYASYRVAAVMQELVAYEPDLFVLYTGHNEFLEARQYADVIALPRPVRWAGAAVAQTRIYALLSQSLRSAPSKPLPEAPTLPAEVRPILDDALGPQHFARATLQRDHVRAHFGFNLRRMLALAEASGVPVVLVAPAANLRDCSPFKSEFRETVRADQQATFLAALDSARAALEANRLDDALDHCRRAEGIDDDYAHLFYVQGKIYDALRQFDQARRNYQRAADEDVCPLRATSALRQIVLQAGTASDALVVDAHTLLEQATDDGIAGRPWFVDHVHPTIAGNRLIALEIVRALQAAGIVTADPPDATQQIAAATERVEASIAPTDRAAALRTVAQVMWWAGKSQQAYRAACEALRLAPQPGEADFLAGYFAEQTGRVEQAMTHYQRLSQAPPAGVSPPRYFLRAMLRYGRLLADARRWQAARRQFRRVLELAPDFADARQELYYALLAHGELQAQSGETDSALKTLAAASVLFPNRSRPHRQRAVALYDAGRTDEALDELRWITERQPDDPLAWRRLGRMLADSGDFEAAQQALQTALRLQPDDAMTQQQLRRIERQQE